jgi:hypothetical protein
MSGTGAVDRFESLERRIAVGPPCANQKWTLYQIESAKLLGPGLERDPADWGMACIYRFDRSLPPAVVPRLLALTAELGRQLGRMGLAEVVRIAPYYAVGADYLAQVKPPYDGGYNTSRFGEFVAHASCKPPPGFVIAHAGLVDALVERLSVVDAGVPARSDVVRAVLHASLIRPWHDLFWEDSRSMPFVLYQLSVEPQVLASWDP